MRVIIPVFFLVAALSAGCTSMADPNPMISSTEGTTLVQIGVVTDIRDIAVRGGTQSGVGATVGALLGGIAGSSIGSGFGRSAATVAGATAGGIAGQQIAGSNSGTSVTRMSVQLENGAVRTYDLEPGESFRVGETVKVISNAGKISITR
jgi:outer membrane lipoprotein SlyB